MKYFCSLLLGIHKLCKDIALKVAAFYFDDFFPMLSLCSCSSVSVPFYSYEFPLLFAIDLVQCCLKVATLNQFCSLLCRMELTKAFMQWPRILIFWQRMPKPTMSLGHKYSRLVSVVYSLILYCILC